MKRTKKAIDARTFKEWKAAGYHVNKGQKSSGRNDKGEATFTKLQVSMSRNCPDQDWAEDDHQFWYDIYGYDRDWA